MRDAELHRKLVEFWDPESDYAARFRRILTGAGIGSVADVEELDRIWDASTEEALGYILRDIPIQPTWSVLEIGAGIGRLLRPLAARVATAHGVDVSAAMAAYSVEYLRDAPNARVSCNDGRSLAQFADEEFDFCYSMLCFQHIPDVGIVRSYLGEIRRVLRPGGLLRLQVKKEPSFLARLAAAVRHRDPARLRRTSFRTWRSADTVGFRGNRYSRRALDRLLSERGLVACDWQEGLGRPDWLWVTASRPS